MKVQIKIIDQRLHEMMPRYATEGSAAFDVVACIQTDYLLMYPGEHERIGLGFEIAIPAGYMGVLAPRSSKGEQGLVLANTVGIIDSDYRGEVKASLWNRSDDKIVIVPLERIAQMVIVPVVQAQFEVVDELTTTERGAGGFGSTGK